MKRMKEREGIIAGVNRGDVQHTDGKEQLEEEQGETTCCPQVGKGESISDAVAPREALQWCEAVKGSLLLEKAKAII